MATTGNRFVFSLSWSCKGRIWCHCSNWHELSMERIATAVVQFKDEGYAQFFWLKPSIFMKRSFVGPATIITLLGRHRVCLSSERLESNHTYLESRRVGSYPCHSKREEHHRQVSAERIICLFKCILSTGETFTSPNMRFIRPACFLRYYDTLESRQMHSLLLRSEYENLIHYITFTHSISLCSTKWFRLSFGGRDRPIDFQ